MTKWISIDKQLPQKDKVVLIVDGGGDYSIDSFDPGSGWEDSSDVLAWTEIEPYAKKENALKM